MVGAAQATSFQVAPDTSVPVDHEVPFQRRNRSSWRRAQNVDDVQETRPVPEEGVDVEALSGSSTRRHVRSASTQVRRDPVATTHQLLVTQEASG
jgi:hypothetical protein